MRDLQQYWKDIRYWVRYVLRVSGTKLSETTEGSLLNAEKLRESVHRYGNLLKIYEIKIN